MTHHHKTVTIGLKVDMEFVRLLNANVQLSNLRQKDEMQPIDQLALIALIEMRGGLEEDVHAVTLHAWRDHITVVPEFRKVEQEATI